MMEISFSEMSRIVLTKLVTSWNNSSDIDGETLSMSKTIQSLPVSFSIVSQYRLKTVWIKICFEHFIWIMFSFYYFSFGKKVWSICTPKDFQKHETQCSVFEWFSRFLIPYRKLVWVRFKPMTLCLQALTLTIEHGWMMEYAWCSTLSTDQEAQVTTRWSRYKLHSELTFYISFTATLA